MFPRVKDKQLLKNYNKIWQKIGSLMGKDFDSKPFYGDKYLKTKIRTFEDSIITNFYDNKMPEEKVPCNKVPIIMLDSVLYAYEMYHPQTYLEECKQKQQKAKTKTKRNYNDEELKSDSDSNDETESDETESDADTNDKE